jgi:hypothetical protein
MTDMLLPENAMDIIGDIHDHAAALAGLLEKLGYHGCPIGEYRHPDVRKVGRPAWEPCASSAPWTDNIFNPGLLDTPWLYPATDKSVFFKHYWLRRPVRLLAEKTRCVDLIVAKGLPLTAHCFDGRSLNAGLFVTILHSENP